MSGLTEATEKRISGISEELIMDNVEDYCNDTQ